MSAIYQMAGQCRAYTKGAVERIIDLCTSVGIDDDNRQMTDEVKSDIMKQMDEPTGSKSARRSNTLYC